MKPRALQVSVWTMLLVLLAGNVVMSLWSVHLLAPSIAGVFGIAAFLEWRRHGRSCFLVLAAAGLLGMLSGPFGLAEWLFVRGWNPVMMRSGMVGRLLGFGACLFAAVGSAAWLMENVKAKPDDGPEDQKKG